MTRKKSGVTDRGQWLRCPDCASTIREEWPHPRLLAITIEHSTSCPAWPHVEREVAVVLTNEPTAVVEKVLADHKLRFTDEGSA